MTPNDAAELMLKHIQDTCKAAGLPKDQEGRVADAMLGGMFMGPPKGKA